MLGKETESCVTYIEKFRFTKSMVVFIAYVIATLGMGHFRSDASREIGGGSGGGGNGRGEIFLFLVGIQEDRIK